MRDLMIHLHPGLKWSMLVTRQTTRCLCFIPVATGNVVRVPKKGNFLEHFLELSLGWGEGGRANRTKHKNKTNIKISSLSFWETFPTSMVAWGKHCGQNSEIMKEEKENNAAHSLIPLFPDTEYLYVSLCSYNIDRPLNWFEIMFNF